MIPLLQAELVKRKGWLSDEEIMDYYSIGQCTPGIIAVNVSTFTGYKLAGFWGAVCATAGIVTPSLLIITLLANILSVFFGNPYVMNAFTGMRIVVIALMCDVVLGMWRKNITDWLQWLIFIAVICAMFFASASPMWVVIITGLFGLFMHRGVRR